MMSLIADLNIRKGRDYGQECKGDAMCIGGGRSSPPPPTRVRKRKRWKEKLKEVETEKKS